MKNKESSMDRKSQKQLPADSVSEVWTGLGKKPPKDAETRHSKARPGHAAAGHKLEVQTSSGIDLGGGRSGNRPSLAATASQDLPGRLPGGLVGGAEKELEDLGSGGGLRDQDGARRKKKVMMNVPRAGRQEGADGAAGSGSGKYLATDADELQGGAETADRFHSNSLNQWAPEQPEGASASFARSVARTSEDLTPTPSRMPSKGARNLQRQRDSKLSDLNQDLPTGKRKPQLNIQDVISEAQQELERARRPHVHQGLPRPEELGFSTRQASPARQPPSDVVRSRKVMLEDAIVNTNIKFKDRRTNKQQQLRSKHALASTQQRFKGMNNATPLSVGKSDLRAFARYGVVDQDMVRSSASFGGRSKSKNAVLYERTRYLDLQRMSQVEGTRRPHDTGSGITEESQAQSNYEYYRERAARSQLSGAQASTATSYPLRLAQASAAMDSSRAGETGEESASQRPVASRSHASTSLNLTFQSSRIKEGNFLRWPQGLTKKGALLDPQFKQLHRTHSKLPAERPPTLPSVQLQNIDELRATRYAVSSLQNSLDDYRTQGGLFLPKVVADLPSARTRPGQIQEDHSDHQAEGLDSTHGQTMERQRWQNKTVMPDKRANPGRLVGFHTSAVSSETEDEVGAVVLLQDSYERLVRNAAFVPNPALGSHGPGSTGKHQQAWKQESATHTKQVKVGLEQARNKAPNQPMPSDFEKRQERRLKMLEKGRQRASTQLDNYDLSLRDIGNRKALLHATSRASPEPEQYPRARQKVLGDRRVHGPHVLAQSGGDPSPRNSSPSRTDKIQKRSLQQVTSAKKPGSHASSPAFRPAPKQPKASPDRDPAARKRNPSKAQGVAQASTAATGVHSKDAKPNEGGDQSTLIANLKDVKRMHDQVKAQPRASPRKPAKAAAPKSKREHAQLASQKQQSIVDSAAASHRRQPTASVPNAQARLRGSKYGLDDEIDSDEDEAGGRQKLSEIVGARPATDPDQEQERLPKSEASSRSGYFRLSESVHKQNLNSLKDVERAHQIDPYCLLFQANTAQGSDEQSPTSPSPGKSLQVAPPASLAQIHTNYAIGIQHELLLSKARCKRLVPSQKQRENEAVELQASQSKEFFVYSFDSEATFVRMFVKDQNSPLKLKIRYLERSETEARKQDLQVYQSARVAKPSAAQHDRKYADKPETVQIFAYDEAGERLKVFEREYIYVGFFSASGCRIQVSYSHHTVANPLIQMVQETSNQEDGDEIEIAGGSGRSTRSKIFQMLLQIYVLNCMSSSANVKMSNVMAVLSDESLMQDVIPKEDPYYQEMLRIQKAAALRVKQAKRGGSSADEDGDPMTGHLFNHPLLQFYHGKRALSKKEELDLRSHKIKLFKMHRWDIIKGIKRQLEQQFADVFKQRQKARLQITMVKLDFALRRLAARFQVRVQQACRDAQARYISFRIGYLFIQNQKKLRGTIRGRHHARLRQILSCQGTLMLEACLEPVAKNMLLVLFTRRQWLGTFLDRMRDTFFQITFIQKKFRDGCQLMKQRRHVLQHSILPQQTLQVTSQILAASDAASHSIGMKIVEMSAAKKDFVCETFIVLAKLDFRKQFLDWYIRTKIDAADYPEDFEEKRAEIVESIKKADQQLEKLLNFIYHGETGEDASAARRSAFQTKLVKRAKVARGKASAAGGIGSVIAEASHRRQPARGSEEQTGSGQVVVELAKDEAAGQGTEKTRPQQDEDAHQQEKNQQANAAQAGNEGADASIVGQIGDVLRDAALKRQQAIAKMRALLDSMSRPKFALFSALDNSLLKLLLIRTAEIGERTDHDDGGALSGVEEAGEMEWYRREYFGGLCKWAADLDDFDCSAGTTVEGEQRCPRPSSSREHDSGPGSGARRAGLVSPGSEPEFRGPDAAPDQRCVTDP